VKVLIAMMLLLAAVVIFGLLQGWLITWGSFTDEELKEMRVDPGRNNRYGNND
jgi:hypothetical protein